jgi:hypothetical protein
MACDAKNCKNHEEPCKGGFSWFFFLCFFLVAPYVSAEGGILGFLILLVVLSDHLRACTQMHQLSTKPRDVSSKLESGI